MPVRPVLIRRCAAKWKYYIWLILAVWLLVPVSLNLPAAPVSVAAPTAEFTLPSAERYTDAETVAAETVPKAGYTAGESATAPSAARTISLTNMLMLVWLVGALGFIVWHWGCYMLLRRRIAQSGCPPEREQTLDVFSETVKRLGCGREVKLLICPQVSCPMVFGYVKSTVVLPGEDYTQTETEHILCHELTHLKRHDLWYKLLLLAANAVHWFNPAVYVMTKAASADLELCCDDDVAKSLDEARRVDYSRTILSGASARGGSQELLTTAFTGSKAQLKRRILNILSVGNRRGGLALLLAALLTVGLLGGLVSCSPARDLAKDSIRIIDAEAESGGVRIELVSAMGDGLNNDFEFKVWLPEEARTVSEPAFGFEEARIEFNTDSSGFSPSGGGFQYEQGRAADGAYAFSLRLRCKYYGSDGGRLNDGTVRTLHLEDLTLGEMYTGVWDFDFEYLIPLDIREYAAAPVEAVFTDDGSGETFGASVTSFRLSNFAALCEFTLEDEDAQWSTPVMSVELKDGKSVALYIMSATKGGKDGRDVALETMCAESVEHSEIKCVRLGDTLLYPDGRAEKAEE